MNVNQNDKKRGIYNKYAVIRTDGSSAVGERHHGCRYFVLDLTHDPHARIAARAYADSCRADYPLLASDLNKLMARSATETNTSEKHEADDESCGVCGGSGRVSRDVSPTDDYAISFSTGCRACDGTGRRSATQEKE